MFWFSLQLLSEKFIILRRNERDMIKHLNWSSCKVLVILVIFEWKLNFLDRFSKKKSSNIKFLENPSSDSRVVPSGQTRHDEANSLFHNFVIALKTQFLPYREHSSCHYKDKTMNAKRQMNELYGETWALCGKLWHFLMLQLVVRIITTQKFESKQNKIHMKSTAINFK
jgi:hypothetical protein